MTVTVFLSDNLPCEIKILPLYALDHVGPKDPGEFTYKIKTLLGEVYDQPYNLKARLDNPPQEPEPNTDDTWALTEWERYQAAIAHNQRRFEMAHERAKNVAHFILDRCLSVEDRQRIITPADYDVVYQAALTPELSQEVISATLRDFFRGEI